MVSPSDPEKYYLRILLNHVRSPISFQDLLTVNSIIFTTFKQAVEQRGLLETDGAIRECLIEASATRMPSALRKLFVTILVFCNPSRILELWDKFYEFMIDDYASTSSSNQSAINLLLMDINYLLIQHRKSISQSDLSQLNQEFHVSRLMAKERQTIVPPEDLSSIEKLNSDQKYAFDKIIDSVKHKESLVYFIDGPGGTGKTFLYHAILAYLRSNGHIAIATATSGIVATMIPDDRIVHSRFTILMPLLASSTCKISKQSDIAELLCQISIIIWDEATMTHWYAFELLDRALRDVTDVDALFGGKIVILGGDFLKVLPVVSHGSRTDTINSCITNSYIWENVNIIRLKENMRATEDLPFSDLFLSIGDGIEPSIVDDMIRLPSEIVIPWENDQSLNRFICEMFLALRDNAKNKLRGH